ncbi:hypothetical protein LTS09_010319 [Friedmanniomyces endolithicus]|nr:hypothetical protein LTS09_010319 [Friedmanniomyces endolithicus]
MVFSELVPISGGLVEVDSSHKLFTLSAFRTPPYLKLEAPDFLPCRHVVAAADTLARAACHEVYRNPICLTIPAGQSVVVFVGRAVVGVRDMCVTRDAKEERANEGGTEQGRFCRSAMDICGAPGLEDPLHEDR